VDGDETSSGDFQFSREIRREERVQKGGGVALSCDNSVLGDLVKVRSLATPG